MVLVAHNHATKENTRPLTSPLKAPKHASPISRRKPARRLRIRTQVSEAIRRRERTLSPPSSVRGTSTTRAQSTPIRPAATEDVDMDHPVSKSKPLTLPRRLFRPEFRDVAGEKLAKIEPDLADTQLSYIQDALLANGDHLMAALSATTCQPIRSALTETVNVHVEHYTADPPTHMLAIHSNSGKPSGPHRVTLYPAHNIVLATHCSNLPALPTSRPSLPINEEVDGEGYHLELPVIPLRIPHSPSFALLLKFLYTKNSSAVSVSLLPPLPPVSHPSPTEMEPQQVIQLLASTYTPAHLLSYMAHITGLWRNATALGLGYGCEGLYDGIDRAWAVLLAALTASTRA